MVDGTADAYLSVRVLSAYAGLSPRWLRRHLADRTSPLPHYRVGGKLLIRRSEFDAWMAQFRHPGRAADRAPASVPPGVTRPLGSRVTADRPLEQLTDRELCQRYMRMFPPEPPAES